VLLLVDSVARPDGGDEDDAKDDGEHGGGEVIHHGTRTNLTRQREVHRAWRRGRMVRRRIRKIMTRKREASSKKNDKDTNL
jgi:hypothetical protein